MEFTLADGPQHARALERANHVRSARALAKRRIASGHLTAAEVILSHRWELEGMRIAEIVLSQPQWGRKRCDELLVTLSMHETKSVGSMTERQRIAAAALLTAQSATKEPRSSRPRD